MEVKLLQRKKIAATLPKLKLSVLKYQNTKKKCEKFSKTNSTTVVTKQVAEIKKKNFFSLHSEIELKKNVMT